MQDFSDYPTFPDETGSLYEKQLIEEEFLNLHLEENSQIVQNTFLEECVLCRFWNCGCPSEANIRIIFEQNKTERVCLSGYSKI